MASMLQSNPILQIKEYDKCCNHIQHEAQGHTYQPVKSKKRDKIFEKEGFLIKKWDILNTFVKIGLNYQV